jgi:hypothetical protein
MPTFAPPPCTHSHTPTRTRAHPIFAASPPWHARAVCLFGGQNLSRPLALHDPSGGATLPPPLPSATTPPLSPASPGLHHCLRQIDADVRRTLPNLCPFSRMPPEEVLLAPSTMMESPACGQEPLAVGAASAARRGDGSPRGGWPYSCIYFHRRSVVGGRGGAAATREPATGAGLEAMSTTTIHAHTGQIYVAEASLRRVLQAFCVQCPEVGYFQVCVCGSGTALVD